jgi:hypothetical protein
MKVLSCVVLAMLAVVSVAARPLQEKAPARLPYEGTLNIAGTYPLVDISTILSSWRILGALACPSLLGGVHVCLLVENAYPCGIFEVVRQRGKSHYAELGGIMEALGSVSFFGQSSSVTARAAAGDSLQYAEARVYAFVPDLGLSNTDIPLAIPQGILFQVSYVSELDGFGWRMPLVDRFVAPQSLVAGLKSCDKIPDLVNCAGTWGSYWPRIGAVQNPSQVIAAHLQALRAGRAASDSLGRIVLSTYNFEPRTGHYMQMLRPSYRRPVSIGSPLISLYERGAGSPLGAYAFLHYGIFIACNGCMPVTLAPGRPPSY